MHNAAKKYPRGRIKRRKKRCVFCVTLFVSKCIITKPVQYLDRRSFEDNSGDLVRRCGNRRQLTGYKTGRSYAIAERSILLRWRLTPGLGPLSTESHAVHNSAGWSRIQARPARTCGTAFWFQHRHQHLLLRARYWPLNATNTGYQFPDLPLGFCSSLPKR